jgi:prenyltransferase beta subunit
LAFFCLAGLDLLGELKAGRDREAWIEWLWSLQARESNFAEIV